jgi:hypothetical protein
MAGYRVGMAKPAPKNPVRGILFGVHMTAMGAAGGTFLMTLVTDWTDYFFFHPIVRQVILWFLRLRQLVRLPIQRDQLTETIDQP